MSIRELPPCQPVDGCLLRIFVDDSKAGSSVDHRWTETTWEGKGSLFSVPLHWHQYHDEHLEVLQGELDIYYDGSWHRTSPADGNIVVKRTKVHGFRGISGKRMVLKEAVDPVGDYKEAFFRDLSQPSSSKVLLAFRAFYDWDTYPSIGNGWSPLWLDQLVVILIGGFAKLIVPKKVMDAKIIKS
ncbi:hypothetical protein CC86DRAFT_371161 [Ophiobolus disseminans]|uniref:Cupin 2 conserved barrel domain-containing protein n=1 Tax=Ophiobolus disseminans TaxID=1469910 RepID=A0A6A6ZYM6_9PLEO|nr:hypothetical protein CC86DRAFT_371161 [Ophiobolus disseminans]